MEGERRLETRVPARLSRAEGRRFGLTLGAAFVVLGVVLAWRGRAGAALGTAALGAALLLAGLVLPTRLGPVQRAWMGLAAALSRVTTPVFLGVVYFGAILPMGLLLRALGRNPLAHPGPQASRWIARPVAASSRRDMERHFYEEVFKGVRRGSHRR